MTQSALVTGGTGYIAPHLIAALLEGGWDVRTAGRRPRPENIPEPVAYHQVDLADETADLGPLVQGVSRVFHLAGASSSRSTEEEMVRSNVGGTAHLLEAVAAADVEVVVHMSSTSVYGEEEQLPVPVPETVECRPSRSYGKAKLGAEEKVWAPADKGFGAVVLRPVSVHGPGANKLLASAMLDVAIERFMGLPTVVMDRTAIEQRLVHVADVVAASLHLAGREPARGRAFNLAMPTYPTSHEVAEMLADELGLGFELSDDPDCGPGTDERSEARERMLSKGMRDEILFTPERFRFMRKVNKNNRIDLQALLGTGFRFTEPDLRASVSELAAWYCEHRWIL